MAVPNRSERFRVWRNTTGEKTAYFIHQTRVEHMQHTRVDTSIALFTWRVQSHSANRKSLQWPSRLRSQVLGERLSRLKPNFDRANDFRLVASGNTLCGSRIETLQQTMEIFSAAHFRQHLQPPTPLHRTHRPLKQAFGQCAQIQACPTDQNRNSPTPADVLEHCASFTLIISRRKEIGRLTNVDHVMGKAFAILEGWLCAPDVQTSKNLHGIVI